MGNGSGKHMYIGTDGGLCTFDKSFVHRPQEEFFYISNCDISIFHRDIEVDGGEECYMMSVYWLNTWTRYARSVGENIKVGYINNAHLINEQKKTVKTSVQHRTHFKIVSKAMWEYFFKAYGGGPVIAFHGMCKFIIDVRS